MVIASPPLINTTPFVATPSRVTLRPASQPCLGKLPLEKPRTIHVLEINPSVMAHSPWNRLRAQLESYFKVRGIEPCSSTKNHDGTVVLRFSRPSDGTLGYPDSSIARKLITRITHLIPRAQQHNMPSEQRPKAIERYTIEIHKPNKPRDIHQGFIVGLEHQLDWAKEDALLEAARRNLLPPPRDTATPWRTGLLDPP